MVNINLIDNILTNLLENANTLLSVLIIDLDGLIIAKQSKLGFDEELIGALTCILDDTFTRIKQLAETSFASGTINTNEFQIFYLEMSCEIPAFFVLVGDKYTSLPEIVPYSYIIAEKISQILNEWDASTWLPGTDSARTAGHAAGVSAFWPGKSSL